jgi:hypothetical protein
VICPVFPRRSAMRGYGTEQRYTEWIALNGGPDPPVPMRGETTVSGNLEYK